MPSTDPPLPERSRPQGLLAAQLKALAAPVAKHSDSVIEDPRLLDVAMAVFHAYTTGSPRSGGFTRGELRDACGGVAEVRDFEQRFNTFLASEMLLPSFPRPHEHRYILEPLSMVFLLFLERVSHQGGITEVLVLLDSTRSAIERNQASRADVHRALLRTRQTLIVFTDHLLSMLRSRPLRELIVEQERYRDPGLVQQVGELQKLVVAHFQDLERPAREALESAQDYAAATSDFIDRLIDAGALNRGFDLFHPEQYRDAAKKRSIEKLAAVFTHVVADPPDLGIAPASLIEAVEELSPEGPLPGAPPPRPERDAPQDNPLRDIARKEQERRRHMLEQTELILGEHDSIDITDRLRELGWPGGMRLLTDLISASGPDAPYEVEMTDGFFVHPAEEMTYLSQVRLHRNPKWGPDAAEYHPLPEPDEGNDIS
ncbi:hypothetical protein GCM10007079_30770 [Nocardiopsis terrae]|uniref:TIGR02678 family protein n=1 Tax=Nocardiopsis terrae TaxID=372655 RepID=A0ABR9HIQ9_9ACTN|nr:hypothetical protein [Nocardiopsis terrae]MBE1458904.1 hypothetical protein [Nocardiopsis terrae]GHC87024.1 hypothetical protein GCM10007079_30770 [Nocardiopsis terrae]